MGKFIYEGGPKIEIEDRALTHIQLVMMTKLRRGEPMPFSWKEDASVGGGPATRPVHANANTPFQFYGSRPPGINRRRVDALAYTANTTNGLYLVPEPTETSSASRQLADLAV